VKEPPLGKCRRASGFGSIRLTSEIDKTLGLRNWRFPMMIVGCKFGFLKWWILLCRWWKISFSVLELDKILKKIFL